MISSQQINSYYTNIPHLKITSISCSKGSATFKECVLWSWLVGQPAKQPRHQPPANNQTNPTKQPTNQHQPTDQAGEQTTKANASKQTYQPKTNQEPNPTLQNLTGPNNQQDLRIPHHQILRSHLGHMSWRQEAPHPHAPDWGANLPSPEMEISPSGPVVASGKKNNNTSRSKRHMLG